MRRWLLAGAGLLLVAAGVLVYAMTQLDAYLSGRREQLQERVSLLVGRAVTFDTIGVSLHGGLSARVTNLAVADEARFGPAPFLTAARAEAVLELLPALHGEYRVRRVVLREPTVTLQRDAQGWNLVSFGVLGRDASQAPPLAAATPAVAAPAPSDADDAFPIGALLIAAANIDGGTVRCIDRTQQPPLQLTIEQLRVRARDLALGKPLAFEISAALLQSPSPNVTLRGRVEPGSPPNADVQIAWQHLDLAAVSALIPGLSETSLGGSTSGELRVRGELTPATPPLVDGTVQMSGVSAADARMPVRLQNLSGSVTCSAGNAEMSNASAQLGTAPLTLNCRMGLQEDPTLRCSLAAAQLTPADAGVSGHAADVLHDVALTVETRPLAAPLEAHVTGQIGSGRIADAAFRALAIDATGGLDALSVDHLNVQAFDGTITADGACRVVKAGSASCSGHATATNLQLASVLAGQRSAAASSLDGRASVEARVSSSGDSVNAMRDNLRGSAHGAVLDGTLRHVNLAQQIVAALPGAGALVDGPRAHALLDTGETRFESATATVQIAARRVTTDDAVVRAADFSATLRGSGSFDGQLAGKGTFTLSPALAREIIQRVPILDTLKQDSGITVPFRLSGTFDSPHVQPDASALPKALERELSAGAGALLKSPKGAARAGKDLTHGIDRLFGR
jgi:uncharacterized protein involved in outer membrane biogenesis